MSGKKRLILILMLAVLSFGVSFALSLLLRPPAPVESGTGGESFKPDKPVLAGLSLSAIDKVTPNEEKLQELIREANGQIDEYRRKTKELSKLEQRIKLSRELLAKEAQQLEDLRLRLVGPLQDLQRAKDELERTRIAIAKDEQARLKKLAAVYEKMDAASGAKFFERMCENKQEDDVVKILYMMSERSAAKVLAKIGDAGLAARLIGKVKKIKEEG